MRTMFRLRSIRVRMALWYSLTLAVILVAYAGLIYGFLSHRLMGELDDSLRSDLDYVRQTLAWPALRSGERSSALLDLFVKDEPDHWVEVRSLDDQPLLQFHPPGSNYFERQPTLFVHPDAGYRSVKVPDGPSLRVLQEIHDIEGGGPVVICVGRSERQLRHDLRTFLLAHGIGLPLSILVAGLGGYAVTRRVLAPIGKMVQQARSITADRLADRLPVDNPDDELGHLAKVFNDTFARLEGSFAQLKHFTADASHELRTPLTALKSVGEVGLQGEHTLEELREIIGSMLEETDRMARLVDGLLTIARTESGDMSLVREEGDLSELSLEVIECLEVLAEEKGQELTFNAPDPVPVLMDRLVLRQALVNILDNAIKYTPAGGRIRISVRRRTDGGEVTIEDSGPGIAEEHQKRIFERFYRVDKGRSREHGGCGLGLALAKWAVGAHGGTIEFDSIPGGGSLFRVIMPGAGPGI